jgi:hypothetical protein
VVPFDLSTLSAPVLPTPEFVPSFNGAGAKPDRGDVALSGSALCGSEAICSMSEVEATNPKRRGQRTKFAAEA